MSNPSPCALHGLRGSAGAPWCLILVPPLHLMSSDLLPVTLAVFPASDTELSTWNKAV